MHNQDQVRVFLDAFIIVIYSLFAFAVLPALVAIAWVRDLTVHKNVGDRQAAAPSLRWQPEEA